MWAGWGSGARSYMLCAPFPLLSVVLSAMQKSEKLQFMREDAREIDDLNNLSLSG